MPLTMLGFLLDAQMRAISAENMQSVLTVMWSCMGECLKAAGQNCLSDAQLDALTSSTLTAIRTIVERRAEARKRRREAGHSLDDEDSLKRLEEGEAEEQEALLESQELCLAMLQTNGDRFLPIFLTRLWPAYSSLAEHAQTPGDIQVAVCMAADLVEFMNVSALYPSLFEAIVKAMLGYGQCVRQQPKPSADVVQAVVYGLGMCAMHAGPNFEPFVEESLSLLRDVLRFEPEAEDVETWMSVRANAGSAILRHAMHRKERLSAEDVWKELLPRLPFTDDEPECDFVYGLMADQVAQGSPVLTESLSVVVRTLAHALGEQWVGEAVGKTIVQNIQSLDSRLPAAAIASAWESLTAEEREYIQDAMKTFGSISSST